MDLQTWPMAQNDLSKVLYKIKQGKKFFLRHLGAMALYLGREQPKIAQKTSFLAMKKSGLAKKNFFLPNHVEDIVRVI